MFNETASSGVSSSPWKKPKLVVLSKSKSLKRKCKSFALDHHVDESSSTSTASSTIFTTKTNIFSINSNNSSNLRNNDNDDMKYFFEGNSSTATFNEEQNDENEAISLTSNIFSSLQSSILANITQNSDQKQETKMKPVFESDKIPIDWSLKTRLRFTSYEKFACCNNIKSIHESQAVSNFAKFNEFYYNLEKNASNTDDLHKTLYCEAMSYWMFPNLPWLKLYPRENCLNIANAVILPIEAQKSLHNQWTLSFKSLYNSVKSNECPYFYMLTQTFMVLFRAENICGIDEIHAIITPSTKGMRKALKDEEIDFTLPMMNKEEIIEKDENISDEINKKQQNEDDDCEANEWLEEIGLDTKQIKVSTATRNQIQESMETLDNKPNSTVLVKGGDVQGLFNFLLNSKICFSNSGPMCGIPPTLLAPSCFLGATLQKLKFQQTLIKTLNNEGESITKYTIDLSGPIMPFMIHRLCKLFTQSQKGQFEMVSNSLLSSLAFNCIKYANNDIYYLGNNIDKSEEESLKNKHGLFNGTATCLNSIICENKIYRCYH